MFCLITAMRVSYKKKDGKSKYCHENTVTCSYLCIWQYYANYWLSVQCQANVKLATYMFETLHTVHSLLATAVPVVNCWLQSVDTYLHARDQSLSGWWSFAIGRQQVLNKFPASMHLMDNHTHFRYVLNVHLVYRDCRTQWLFVLSDQQAGVTHKAQLTNRKLSVEAKLVNNILWNVSLDGLLGLALSCLQQPIELLRIKLLHMTVTFPDQLVINQ